MKGIMENFTLPQKVDHLLELLEYNIISRTEFDKHIHILLPGYGDDEHDYKDNDYNSSIDCLELTNESERDDSLLKSPSQVFEDYDDIEYDAQRNKLYVTYRYTKNDEGKDILTVRKVMRFTQNVKMKSTVIAR